MPFVWSQMPEQQLIFLLKHIRSDSRGRRMGSKCGKRCKTPQKNAWSSATVKRCNKQVPSYVSARHIVKGSQPYWCIMMILAWHILHGYNEVHRSFVRKVSVLLQGSRVKLIPSIHLSGSWSLLQVCVHSITLEWAFLGVEQVGMVCRSQDHDPYLEDRWHTLRRGAWGLTETAIASTLWCPIVEGGETLASRKALRLAGGASLVLPITGIWIQLFIFIVFI